MKNELKYYLENIKPIEKKYNRYCILYSFLKIPYFYYKKVFYNDLLIKYYKSIQNNKEFFDILEKTI